MYYRSDKSMEILILICFNERFRKYLSFRRPVFCQSIIPLLLHATEKTRQNHVQDRQN